MITAQQTVILFLLMSAGMLARRARLLDAHAVACMTDFVLYIVTPCLIVSAFQRPFDATMLVGLGWAFVGGAMGHSLGILVARTLVRDRNKARERILRFATVFSNAGFMGLPLEYAIFGSDGVFYGIAYVTMFNVFCWTYGVKEIGVKGIALRQMIVNPGTVGVFVGLLLFFLPFRLPTVLASPIQTLGSLNTPLPMIVIGYHLAGAKLLPAFRVWGTYRMLICRHLLVPLLAIGILFCCPFIDTMVRLVTCIAVSAPIGVLLSMFTLKADGDVDYSTALVSVSTILSIATLPLLVGFARWIMS